MHQLVAGDVLHVHPHILLFLEHAHANAFVALRQQARI